jgi:hypothetical protein
MLRVLYPLLEKLGDSATDVSTSAFVTLQRVCKLCKYDKISELVAANADYLVDAISHRMKYLDVYVSTPKVFLGLVKFTGIGFLPLLDDTIDLVLHSIDLFSSPLLVYSFVKILHSIICILYQTAIEEREARKLESNEEFSIQRPSHFGTMENDEPRQQIPIEDIREYFTTYHEGKKEAETSLQTEGSGVAGNDAKRVDRFDTKITKRQRAFTKCILEKIRHFSASSVRELKLLVLDLIAKGVVVLSASGEYYQDCDNVDSTPVYPVVHMLWENIVARCASGDHAVAMKALEVVNEITTFGGEFLRSKFVHELWPVLKIVIQREQNNPQQANRYSMNHRVQVKLLHCLTNLSIATDFTKDTLDNVIITCAHFLQDDQPIEFRDAVSQLFNALSIKNSVDAFSIACAR